LEDKPSSSYLRHTFPPSADGTAAASACSASRCPQAQQERAIDKTYSCAKQWPFMKKLQIHPTADSMNKRFNRQNYEGCGFADRAAWMIHNDELFALGDKIAAIFENRHMTSWERYCCDFYVNFRANCDSVAEGDLQMLLTWFDPPNTSDVPYDIGYNIECAARTFINHRMETMFDMFGWEQPLRVVVEFLQGSHLACWQTIKWELQRATASHRECRCEHCSRRGHYDPNDADFAVISNLALGSSSRLEHRISRGGFLKRFQACLNFKTLGLHRWGSCSSDGSSCSQQQQQQQQLASCSA
jgi:hypothetical protein